MTKDVLMELVKHVLTAPIGAYLEPMPVPMRLPDELDHDELYDMSVRQKVEQIAGYALKWSEDTVEDYERFDESVNWAIALESAMYFETGALFDAFEREGIDYCPINGLVTKRFYPLPWMRTMNDADVLIREKDVSRAKQIALSVGFIEDRLMDGVATFASGTLLYRLELHVKLAVKDAVYGEDVWDKLEPEKRNGHRYEMTNIGQLVYILQRCDKHMNTGGIKVLSILDFILLKRALGLDEALARRAVESVGLTETFDTLNAVSAAWLDYGNLTRKQRTFVDGIFTSRDGKGRGVMTAFARAFKAFKVK